MTRAGHFLSGVPGLWLETTPPFVFLPDLTFCVFKGCEGREGHGCSAGRRLLNPQPGPAREPRRAESQGCPGASSHLSLRARCKRSVCEPLLETELCKFTVVLRYLFYVRKKLCKPTVSDTLRNGDVAGTLHAHSRALRERWVWFTECSAPAPEPCPREVDERVVLGLPALQRRPPSMHSRPAPCPRMMRVHSLFGEIGTGGDGPSFLPIQLQVVPAKVRTWLSPSVCR